jgi:hypothetical protein
MSIFDAFERAIRGVVQSPFQRVLPSQVQEQEILDALRKVMDDHVQTEQGRQVAPSSFTVLINQQDFQGLTKLKPSVDELERLRQRLGLNPNLVRIEQLADLATRVQLELRAVAINQNYLLKNALRVTFQPDPTMARGRFVAGVATTGTSQPMGAVPVDQTHTLMQTPVAAGAPAAQPAPAPVAPRGPAPSISMPPAWLTLIQPSRGQPFRLDRTIIKIGRGDGNDIVINEKRVSRAHAEIRYDHGVFTIHDMASQNGVAINNVNITRPAPLKDGDRIKICGYEFVFQLQRR